MKLNDFFAEYPDIAIAFSGGTDSSYLLYAAVKAGANVRPYYVKSAFQPVFELEDAERLCRELGVSMRVIECDVLEDPMVRSNPADRCYYCKRRLFGLLTKTAAEDGYRVLADGTNASDLAGDRPGMKALEEMKVLSPLRMCGLTKDMIRQASRDAGLFTWNKPAYACLATRIPTGVSITRDTLEKIEAGEQALFDMGFSDFRIRVFHDAARIQIPENQMPRVLAMRATIRERLKPFFPVVLLDLEERPGMALPQDPGEKEQHHESE